VSNFANVRNDQTGKILKQRIDRDGYKTINIKINGVQKQYKIHRLVSQAFIPNPDNKPFVDHINGIRSDNNINNLRWVTNSENNYNSKIPTTNKSGYKGVVWHKKSSKWIATIQHNHKTYYLGSFTNKEDARIARQLKANELFKEFTHKSGRVVNLNIKLPPNINSISILQ
jgi:hypothetical protein